MGYKHWVRFLNVDLSKTFNSELLNLAREIEFLENQIHNLQKKQIEIDNECLEIVEKLGIREDTVMLAWHKMNENTNNLNKSNLEVKLEDM